MQGFTKKDLTRGTSVRRVQNNANSFDSNLTAASRIGTTLTAEGTTAHTKGAYAELIASTSATGYGLWIRAMNSSTANTARVMLADIALGDAAAESIIIPNLQVGTAGIYASNNIWPRQYYFPGLSIPSGSRISARVQGVVVASTVILAIHVDTGAVFDAVETTAIAYNVDTTTSRAPVEVTPGSGAFGAWSDVGTTSRDHRAFVLVPDQSGDGALANRECIAELGYGTGGGSEIAIASNLSFGESAGEAFCGTFPPVIFAKVASGQHLFVRLAQNNTTPTRGVSVYAV